MPMLFQGRIDRAQKWLHERSDSAKTEKKHSDEDVLPSMEDLRREAQEEMELEKGDGLAMLIAALITILPVGLLVLLAMVGFMFFFM